MQNLILKIWILHFLFVYCEKMPNHCKKVVQFVVRNLS